MRVRVLQRQRSAARLTVVMVAALAMACTSGVAFGSARVRAVRVTATHIKCTTKVAKARGLSPADVATTRVGGLPFGAAVTAAGAAFVTLGPQVGSFRLGAGGHWHLVAKRKLPTPFGLGEALTDRGRYLLVADAGDGAIVLAVHGNRLVPVGILSGPPHQLGGAIEVAATRNGSYAFVSMEGSQAVAVFALRRALTSGFSSADYVGSIPVGIAPVGLAVSPDGRWLYVTSELELGARSLAVPGTLTVVSIRKAELDPAKAVVTTVTAGCQPVRVITSADGSVVWVTARASDRLLGFSAQRLRTDPKHALIARVRVGEAPVGLALVRGGSRIVVGDSNRFGVPGDHATLAVVSVQRALFGGHALLGYLPAGQFPRDMVLDARDRVLLVTNYGSGQLESVRVPSLP